MSDFFLVFLQDRSIQKPLQITKSINHYVKRILNKTSSYYFIFYVIVCVLCMKQTKILFFFALVFSLLFSPLLFFLLQIYKSYK